MKTKKEKNIIKENVNNKAAELNENELNLVTGAGDKFESTKSKENKKQSIKEIIEK